MSGGGSPERPIEPPSPPGGDRGSPPPCVCTAEAVLLWLCSRVCVLLYYV